MNITRIAKTAALCLSLTAATGASAQAKPYIYKPANDLMLTALSDNAKYAISTTMGDTDVDNPRPAGAWLLTVDSNTAAEIPAPTGWAAANDVADSGLVVGESGGKPGKYDPSTGQWTTYTAPAGWSGGAFMAVTPDGTRAVGYYRDAADEYQVAPMAYDLTTGKRLELGNLPTVDLAGEDKRQNVFYCISADGRYALGQMSQSYLLPVSPLTYVYDLQEQTWTPVGFDYNAATQQYKPQAEGLHFVYSQTMSADGQWVAGTAYVVEGGLSELEGGVEYFAPYRYHVPTGKFELYTEAGDREVAGNRITNDGVILGSTPVGNPYPMAVVRSGKYFISMDQILKQVYGTTLWSHIGDTVTGSFQAVSADGLTAVLHTYDNCYLVRMAEPWAEAASRVDLLANYAPSIPSGSAISKIAEVKITFDRAIAAQSLPSAVKLTDASGNVVRSASGFAVSATNDHQLVVTFRTTALEAGKEYAVEIPAGMIWLKDDPAIKSKAISLSYIGRADTPVQPVRAIPASGSAVAQFNANPDVLMVEFDTPIAVSESAECALYNLDDGAKVADMMCQAQGSVAYFYPAATYHLYKGTAYQVRIGAGSVTDMSGAGPCQAIALDYDGAYVRQLTDDDTHIFSSKCDNYEYFMMWKPEAKAPGSVPQQWGFEADNIWLLLRDNEQTDDWAMAAHSMFATPGASDDWLVTPQLYIPDGNAYLAFDAQSYLRSKADVLKVYVYACDAVHNYIGADFVADVLEHGDLVVEERLSAGATDEGLDGEWTAYNVPLEKYAGQNIYVAFVNQNYDQSAVFIDNVMVVRNMSVLITNQTPQTVVDANEVTVKGILSLGNIADEFSGFEIVLRDGSGAEVDAIAAPDLHMAYGDAYPFAFSTPLPLTPGEAAAYAIEVTTGGATTPFAYTVKDLLFRPEHRVVLEEYTGSSCGNCPLGIRAIEHLKATYPDNFIAVALRTFGSDIHGAGLADYSQYLGCDAAGAPSGRVNRGPVLYPAVKTAEGYRFNGRGVVQTDGTEAYLWADAVQDALDTPADAAIEAKADYDPATGAINVDATVTYAVNAKGVQLGVFAVLVENGLQTYQDNYYSGDPDPLLGEWGLGGMYGQTQVLTWLADDVARLPINGSAFNGTPLAQSDFEAGSPCGISLSATVPEGRIAQPANCRVVCMAIDQGTQRVVNAVEVPLTLSGITSATADDQGQAEYYDLQGVRHETPVPGRIYIRRGAASAKVVRF